MRVLSSEQMAAVDRRAIEDLGIPGPVLMENAASGAVDVLGERFPRASSIAIFCGPGNNGGDGYAMARLLDARGYTVDVFRAGRRPQGDALLQLEILERAGREVTPLPDEAAIEDALQRSARADVLVDSLFGTGLSRPLTGLFAKLAEGLDGLGVPILAVDLPSGLSGSRPEIIGPHLRADVTVTFAAPKIAHVLAPTCDEVGELVVVEFGMPAELVDEAPGSWHLLRSEDMAAQLLPATPGAHKGTFGHVLVIGGCRGTSGAVILATRAAVRAGAGLVTAAVPQALLDLVEMGSVESMTVALESSSVLSVSDVDTLAGLAAPKHAVVLGPGLGQHDSTASAVLNLLGRLDRPLVLDADGLNALRGDLAALAGRSPATVLTPHPGEMARLLGVEVADVEADRPAAALELARLSGAIAVLKGRRSLIASPGGELFINPTGNAGMATGGSGDVLAGIIAALLAQGYDGLVAACLGVYVHGLAGDLAAESSGRAGLAAGDLVSFLPAAWRRLA